MPHILCSWRSNTCMAFQAHAAVWNGRSCVHIVVGPCDQHGPLPLPILPLCTAEVALAVVDQLVPFIASRIVRERRASLVLGQSPYRGMMLITTETCATQGRRLAAGSTVRVLRPVRCLRPATSRTTIPVEDQHGTVFDVPHCYLRRTGDIPDGSQAMDQAIARIENGRLGCWARLAAGDETMANTCVDDWLTPAYRANHPLMAAG